MGPVRGSRIERKKEETKKKIIVVAMDLFVKQGFDKTTVEQIAEEADIAKGTIYNHFPVKEAIISEYILQEIKERGPEVALSLQELPDTRSRLIKILQKSLEWVEFEFDKELYKKYFAYRMQTLGQSIKGETPRSGFQLALAHIIALGQETGEIRKDIPSEVLAQQLESLHAVTVANWLYIPERFSVDKSISWNVDLLLNGVKA